MPHSPSIQSSARDGAGVRTFCTYFDHHFLPRGLALYESLRQHCPAFRLWVLCLSAAGYEILQHRALPGLELIALEELERADTALLGAKGNRSLIEYYFTLSPLLPLYIFERNPGLGQLTYLDSDLFVFGPLEPLWQEIDAHSIVMTPHRFSPALREREKFGRYNVGWLTFARDAQGLGCLAWWRERCLEWCYDRYEDDRFADQKYLEAWPKLFPNTLVLQHPGANLAPWNVAGCRLSLAGDQVRVDGQPLVFYHFHGLKQLSPQVYDPQWRPYHIQPNAILRDHVYWPYLRQLAEASLPSDAQQPALPAGTLTQRRAMALGTQQLSWVERWKRRGRIWRGVLTGKYFWIRKTACPPQRPRL